MSTVRAYYNDVDPFVCAWVRELIRAGQVTDGEVDERPIQQVEPADLVGFDRAHFFCGIAGWDLALNLAGWGDRPVWTGSAPCQPFSSAGKGDGGADPRHLWPAWFRLIRECRPPVVIGEQVEAAVQHGWLDAVFGDLEGEGYACGAAVLGAHSVGAPHIRQRLWFVANACAGRRIGSEIGHAAPDGERDMETPQQGRHTVAGTLGASMQPHWPSGPGAVSRVSIATDGLSGVVAGRDAVGNAIVPQVAAAFIEAYLGVRHG